MKLSKKILPCFLTAVMLINNFGPIAVMAMETKEKEGTASAVKIEPKGNIEVEAHLSLPIRNREKTDIVFTVSNTAKKSASIHLNDIKKAQDGIYETSIELGGSKVRAIVTKRDFKGSTMTGEVATDNIVYYSINLYSLDEDTYTLKFSDEGNGHFVTYSVDVPLYGYSKRVSINNESGMFEIGDLNNDNKVDAKDEKIMINSIQTNDTKNDLNLDGVTDIADLNYITAVMNSKKGSAKIENTGVIMDSDNVTLDLTKATVTSGSLDNLFNDGDGVTLKPAKNEKISESNPIELAIDLGKNASDTVEMSEVRIAVGSNKPTKGKVIVETEDGEEETDISSSDTTALPFTDEVAEGVIRIDLKRQVAVKKVTIIITETTSSDNLADIAKVEFLNNVKTETKEPEGFATPKNIKVDGSVSEQLTVTFDDAPNVTGYEIEITGPKMNGVIFQTTYNKFTIEDLKNGSEYKIRVRSVNQEWRSDWSGEHKCTPKSNRKPPAVDMVTANPTFSGIDFGWKDMDDTETYNIYYRKVGQDKYQVIRNIEGTSYALRGLEASTTYEAYLTGNNFLGEGSKSQTVTATTLKHEATITPKYKLINDTVTNGKTSHIKDVIVNSGIMTDNNKFAMVDDNFKTSFTFNNWAAGSHYNKYNMPTTILDKAYTMDEFVLTVPDEFNYTFKSGTYDKNSGQYNDTLVYYWNTDEAKTSSNATVVPAVITAKKDKNNRPYYVVKLEDPITANAIQFGLTNAQNANLVQVAEVKFYEYDSLVDDVAKLFTDDMRLELADGVDINKIEELRKRANTQDHDEYSPYKESVLADLDYAEKILNDEAKADIITLNPNISNSLNGNLGFAMQISDYQPLGVVARPETDKTLTVYVGTSKGKLGDEVNAEIVFTQYNAEANAWNKSGYKLKKGQNIIDIPTIGSASSERGGSVYVRYTSKPDANNPIKIRVSGGTKIPVLDTTLLDDKAKKEEAISNYIKELDNYVSTLKEDDKKGTGPLDSTEIATKYGLWSVSATAVKDALDTLKDDKENRLYESTEAFTEMMELFYRHKGLSKDASEIINRIPNSRINIRYMTMFDGAFMYAGGYHIGIGYGSIAGLVQAKKNTSDATGYFGWGISHEIGHQINQSNLVFAEVTNNVYSLLAQTSNDKDKSRLETSKIYEKIYEKVTSHTLGRAQNVFVQLGMYWQLHLAYDDNKTFEDENSIFAKINKLSRTYNNVNKYDKDQLLIVLASMAAEKDLTDYFETWGLKANDKVKEELKNLKLEKETRAIYYLNDEARRYRLGGGTKAESSSITANIEDMNSEEKRVTINFNIDKDSDKILGYEILRNDESIGFVDGKTNTFTDNIGSVNNRAFTYKVVAYDYLLNKVDEKTLDEVKVAHDGSIKKDNFTIESNVKEDGEVIDYEDEKFDYSKLKVNNLIDGNKTTGFNGTKKIEESSKNTDNAYVIINLNTKLSLSGIKYRALTENGELNANTIRDYKISVSRDKNEWTAVRQGTFNVTKENPEEIVYFVEAGTNNENQLYTYDDISYVKIEAVGKQVLSGAEIDIIAPPGDNIDISMTTDNKPSIGKVTEDYCYLKDGCENDKDSIIEAGSVVIKGTYRGNPAFNLITIADAFAKTFNKDNIYSGYQLIFANVTDDMKVYDVAEGTWLYVMTKEQYEKMVNNKTSIRAYLYRVKDALTNDGQRITSTSMAIDNLPSYNELSEMTFTSEKK